LIDSNVVTCRNINGTGGPAQVNGLDRRAGRCCVLLFLTPDGAEAGEVPEIGAAVRAVRAAVVA
jgi:hypothetical protein